MTHADSRILDDRALDILFRDARSYNGWTDEPVSDVLLHALFDLLKMGPTSANSSPARFVFVKTPEAKERLKPCLDAGNVNKTMSAPVTVLIAHDRKFYDHLPRLFPHTDARSWFAGNDAKIESTARRNGTLQGAYLMMAARALGLDCGPMSGFNTDKVKAEFFADQDVEVNFICALGYGDPASIFGRSPRFDFDDVCKIV
ncbi:malonic semialdehyde reductase [Micavibrio aeruginosavorus]|uniref:malonic semialdehyde reductase n=1 Tax=Micavibrio aeruginosavorus TaxID=349221 RepID=UPI003F4A91A0